MASKERWLLEEAKRWRAEGRVDDAFVEFARERYAVEGSDDGEVSLVRAVLGTVGGIIGLLAVFFLFREFWHVFTDLTKFGILVSGGALSYVAAGVLHRMGRWSVVRSVLIGLGGGLVFFGITYLETFDDVTPAEVGGIVLAFVVALVTLAIGYVRVVSSAVVGTALLTFAFLFIPQFVDLSERGDELAVSAWLAVGFVHALANLTLWTRGAQWRATANWPRWSVPAAGMLQAWILVFSVEAWIGVVIEPQDSWTGILALAGYAIVVLATGILLRYPLLLAVGGPALVGSAVWAGFDKGGLIGTVVALFLVAGALIWLAQSGLLVRWFRSAGKAGAPPEP